MQKDGHLRWLFALVAIVALSCMDVFTHAREPHFPHFREQNDTTNITDSTDTIVPIDTTDTILPPDTIPTDTIPTDTIPTDTIPTDTIPTDTIPTDTIPTDTIPTDTIPTDTIPTDTIVPPIPVDVVIDSLLVYIPDSTQFMIPVTVKVISHEDRTAQLGDGCEASIDSATIGWLLLPSRVYIDSVEYAVTGIGANAFRDCPGIEKIDIPPAVTRVGDNAFYNDTSLNELLITAEDYQLTDIGRAAFAGTRLVEMPLSVGVLSLGDSAFAGCDSLRTIVLNDSLTVINANMFENCRSLTSLTIPDSVTSIGRSAFAGSGLTEMTLPASLIRMGDAAFAGCDSLRTVVLGENLRSINARTFENCGSLTSLTLPESVTGIGRAAFAGSGLAEIALPSGLMGLADSVFSGCRSLASVTLMDSLRVINANMFENCTSLTSLTFPDSLGYIRKAAFAGSGLVDLSLPAGLLSIGDSAFADCEHLSTIAFNDTLYSIGAASFKGCKALSQVNLPNQLVTVGARAFEQCGGLRFFVTGDSLRTLGNEVLSGDSSLIYADLRNSRKLALTEVDRSAGIFGGVLSAVIIYPPNGNDVALGVNVINSVAKNLTYSEGLNVCGAPVNAEDSRKGIGTYLLNQYYGDTIFGQLLDRDSIRVNYPLPYADCPMDVHKVVFCVGGNVNYVCYVNDGCSIEIPSSDDLGIDAPVANCTYVDEEGVEQEFTSMTPIVGDMTVDVEYGYEPGDVNSDGTVDVRDITALIDIIMNSTESNTADVNADDEIDVRDITALINIIMDGGGSTNVNKEVKILCLGNSFTLDAWAYVPYILRNIAPQVRLKVGVLYDGGSTLQNHYEYHFKDTLDYAYYYKYNVIGKWRNVRNFSLQRALNDEEWDIIMLQQGSAESRDYTFYQPYLDSILICLNDTLNRPFKKAWFSIPAYGENYGWLNGSTSNEMFYDIMSCTDSVMTNVGMDYLFPCGTAVQNARTTVLDRLGRYKHLTYDGMHMQEGLPCLIEAYVTTQVLLNALDVDATIDDDYLNVTEDWPQQNSIPQAAGVPVGMTPAYRELGKHCAKMALKSPMEITDCSNFLEW